MGYDVHIFMEKGYFHRGLKIIMGENHDNSGIGSRLKKCRTTFIEQRNLVNWIHCERSESSSGKMDGTWIPHMACMLIAVMKSMLEVFLTKLLNLSSSTCSGIGCETSY